MRFSPYFSAFLLPLALASGIAGCVTTPQQSAESVPAPSEIVADLPGLETAAEAATHPQSAAEMVSHPAAVHISELGAEVLSAMADDSLSEAEREGVFRRILAEGLDVERIGRFALGRYWSRVAPAQRNAYFAVFTDFLAQTYSARPGGVQIDEFAVTGAQPMDGGDILVQSQVNQSTAQPIRADWRVRSHEGGYRVLDLSVEGISMAALLRQEFSAVLRQRGVDGLIAMLKEKTAA